VKNRTQLIRAIPVLLVLLALAACGNVGSSSGSGPSAEDQGGGPTITVGSKNFTEQYVLGELYAQALQANGFNVEKKLDLGSEQIADKALQNGQIDMYPEYTGTSLVAIQGIDANKVPDTPEATYQQAKRFYAGRDPADTMLTPAPFNNTYGIFVRKQVAEQYNLKTLDDLAKASPKLTFVCFSEFQNRADGIPNMQKNYPGLDFGEVKIVNSIGGPIYQGVLQGEGDAGVGFRTDGQLASDELVVMEDPKNIWPFYYPAPVVRSDVLQKYPKMKGVLDKVSSSLDEETMRKLNSEVDIQQEDPEDVAAKFLKEKGIVQ
jgi:osmoprotectant transport system substrate-binding protein